MNASGYRREIPGTLGTYTAGICTQICTGTRRFGKFGTTSTPVSDTYFGKFAMTLIPVPDTGKFGTTSVLVPGTSVTS